MKSLPRIDVSSTDYGIAEKEVQTYRAEGTEKALALPNRGPIKFTSGGELDPKILEAYSEFGFYVLENVISSEELEELEQDVALLLERAPTHRGSKLDRNGSRAFGANCKGRNYGFVKPFSDPVGGTNANHGRHPAKMIELVPPGDAPEEIVQIVLGPLQFSEAFLRLYGHPDLLRVAEAIHGPDFTPFNEALWIKQPRLGGPVAWHQDGWTHWQSPELGEHTHGFNFMGQLYGCDAENGLWIVPGTHRLGKRLDIKQMVEDAGSDRLPDAVPLICNPGDVAIGNRQVLHGSFANTSDAFRVTFNFGFHRRKSVLGVKSGGVHNPVTVYSESYIKERSRLIMYAIDARRQRFQDEVPYIYQPLNQDRELYRWYIDRQPELRDYNMQDIGI
ncbi:phytanoyl-CoA dioxygenase [Candidatus Poribacteria bacterium]|nr:MAG: phytanoyl-CoA dioxygenase [Candidatus Poribacteria bacterium]